MLAGIFYINIFTILCGRSCTLLFYMNKSTFTCFLRTNLFTCQVSFHCLHFFWYFTRFLQFYFFLCQLLFPFFFYFFRLLLLFFHLAGPVSFHLCIIVNHGEAIGCKYFCNT